MIRLVVNYVRPEPHERFTAIAEQRRAQQQLQAENAAVRSHEQAHVRLLGGAAASPVLYDTVRGPDGQSYAVAGKIKVDLSPVPGDPAATLRKARQVRTAALAPNDPSGADMRVAAAAYRLEMQAKRNMASESDTERSGAPGGATGVSSSWGEDETGGNIDVLA